jgi:hypothetical protein
MDDAYNNLAKSIVIEACEDYLNAKRYIYRYNRYALKRKPTKKMEKAILKHQRELEEAVLFLNSDRCILYTGGIDGKTILHHLDERIV